MKPPSLIDRIKYTLDFYRHGVKFFTKQKNDWPFSWPAWRSNTPQWHINGYESLINEGFNRNSILYSAAMYKYYAFKSVPLRAYRGTFEQPELLPADHPLQKICLRPNRFQSGPTFQGMADVFCNLAGTCYIYIKRVKDQPESMYLLRPDRMYIVPLESGNDPIGYYYVPEGKGYRDGIPYMAKDIMCVRMPNPGDVLDGLGEGLAPGSVAAKSINVDNMITDFLQLFFQNGAMPPGYFSYDVPMTSDEMKETREKLMEIYGGYSEWSKLAILDNNGKYTRVGLTFAEMDMSKLDGRNQSLIVAPFGVPLSLITSRPELVASTYNNRSEDRKMFWQDRMWSESKEFEAEYQYYLQGPRGEFVMFDFSQVPALTMTEQERGEQAKSAFVAGGITRNEYRAAIDYGPVDDGDIYLIPTSSVEQPYRTKQDLLAQAIEPTPPVEDNQDGMPEVEEEAVKSVKMLKMSMEQKALFWRKFDKLARDYEDDFGEAAVKALEEDRRNILALLNKGKAQAIEEKASPSWTTFGVSVTDYLINGSTWEDTFTTPIAKLMTTRINQLNEEFSQSYPPAELLKKKWFNEYTIRFAQPINDNTNEVIKRMIEQASNEGWSIDLMNGRLDQMFSQWMTGDIPPEEMAWYKERMPAARREMIARTETIKASNHVSNELYKAWSVVQKVEWLAEMDVRVRPTHAAANGQTVDLGKPFDVGGSKMMYPGDMSAPVGEIVNCRCTTVPIID